MSLNLRDLPELSGLGARRSVVRIPPELDVPLTDRVRQLVDTVAFRRLARISQLGLVSLVYPAAIHTRFEHSLGVYRLALLFLQQLALDPRFAAAIEPADAELLLVTALLHDIGHWPFCHPLEDIRLPGVPRHERLAEHFIVGEVGNVLRGAWRIEPQQVLHVLNEEPATAKQQILSSILSGPIDIDKMDYLARDSLHAGVPYGRNFDQQRLIGSLCLNAVGNGLAITDKGKTAAEMMVFARYVMFSEVYWHHGVRAATAMLQRAFHLLHQRLDLPKLFLLDERQFIAELQAAAAQQSDAAAGELLDGLFGERRQLYKRLAQFSYYEQRGVYDRLARRPYTWLVACAENYSARLAAELRQPLPAHAILFDAPPTEREVEFKVDVLSPKTGEYRPFEKVSPVVRSLAREQFDDYVKRVRVMVHPDWAVAVRSCAVAGELLTATLDELG